MNSSPPRPHRAPWPVGERHQPHGELLQVLHDEQPLVRLLEFLGQLLDSLAQ
jgi:hypothetical protein